MTLIDKAEAHDDDLIRHAAAALWKAEAVDAGTPQSVADGRTPEAFNDQSDYIRARWTKFARAAIAALPPAKQEHVADSNARGVGAPDPVRRPTMTDMMVDPATLDAFMEANPLPDDFAPTAAQAREAALREALRALDALPEYGSPDVNIGVSNAYSAILALITEKPHDRA